MERQDLTQVFSCPLALVGGQTGGSEARSWETGEEASDDGGETGVGAKEVERSRCAEDLTTCAIFTCPQVWTYSFCSNTSKCDEIFIEHLLYTGKGPRPRNIKMNNALDFDQITVSSTVLVTRHDMCGGRDVVRKLRGHRGGH